MRMSSEPGRAGQHASAGRCPRLHSSASWKPTQPDGLLAVSLGPHARLGSARQPCGGRSRGWAWQCSVLSLTGLRAARLYVLADLRASVTPLAPVACNDDFCGYLSQLTVRPAARACAECMNAVGTLAVA